jgi:transposase
LKEKLKDAQIKEGVFWADEMRVGLIGETRRVWAPRGIKVEQEREYVYKWSYLNLAVNGMSGELYWTWTQDMKAASIAPVVKHWARRGVEAVVWDGAKGHHGAAYDDVMVARVFQPPYSPELNPAERVFELLRERIEGKVYGTLPAKKKAVEAELQGLAADPEQVRRLAGWEWIRRSIASLKQENMALH